MCNWGGKVDDEQSALYAYFPVRGKWCYRHDTEQPVLWYWHFLLSTRYNITMEG